MAHSLQAQARTELVLAPAEQPELLEARVRAHFGSAAPIRWAASISHAIRSALGGEVVAVISDPLPDSDGELRVFDVLKSEDGRAVAYAVGRIAADDVAIEQPSARPSRAKSISGQWSPEAWRSRPAEQLAAYPDSDALARVERRLAGSESLVEIADIIHLRAALSRVAGGDGFIVQGGDCAESFAEFSAEKVRVTYNLLLRMGAMLRAASGSDVVHLARIAGQFAKPRSSATETMGEVTLPSYRGDAINGPAFTAEARAPDPKRLLEAHRQAQVTIELLQAYASASYADLPKVHREVGLKQSPRPVAMFTSHEALLLNYEQALTRYDEASEQYWATSGHMLWIGDRTRQLDGAHVEFARGIANPVGLKCGPSLAVDDLLRLMDRLDLDNTPGRLVLIGRFGAAEYRSASSRADGRHSPGGPPRHLEHRPDARQYAHDRGRENSDGRRYRGGDRELLRYCGSGGRARWRRAPGDDGVRRDGMYRRKPEARARRPRAKLPHALRSAAQRRPGARRCARRGGASGRPCNATR